MINIKINDILYPASISGKLEDINWDKRATKTIKLTMDYDTAKALFINGLSWSIVQEETIQDYQYNEEGGITFDETGNPVLMDYTTVEEYDNSDYNIICCITDYLDGTLAVTMGKLTELEETLELLLGGTIV